MQSHCCWARLPCCRKEQGREQGGSCEHGTGQLACCRGACQPLLLRGQTPRLSAMRKPFSVKVQGSPLVAVKVCERLKAPTLLAEALQAALHQECAQLEVLLTNPVALVVLFLLDQVLSTARHLQTTLLLAGWLQSGRASPAQVGTCSWPDRGMMAVSVPQPDACSTSHVDWLAAFGAFLSPA